MTLFLLFILLNYLSMFSNLKKTIFHLNVEMLKS
uniref:Uncharacterized protein n=1 Tax=Rhizophora mucronata TaxID=61149 RepID=A0A2P2L5W7_RHIMU